MGLQFYEAYRYFFDYFLIKGELNGHQNRVLHISLNPEGNVLASAGADETLRFWKLCEIEKK